MIAKFYILIRDKCACCEIHFETGSSNRMPNLLDRNKQILNFIVRDYVKTANPVSSERILQKLKLDVSSATIRNSMMNLEEEGFLTKEHSSSGRLPTDTAYRYFVNYCMSELKPHKFIFEKSIFGRIPSFKSKSEIIDSIINNLARALDMFIALGSLNSKRFASSGSEQLLKQQEFKEHDLVRHFGFILDHLENVVKTCLEEKTGLDENEDVIISIGRENRFKETKVFSIFLGDIKNKEGQEYVLFSLGPTRMDYERNYSLISHTVKNILPKILQ